MTGFGNLARRVMGRAARSLAAQDRPPAQVLRLIPGMPAAPEPVLLPGVWSADKHPRGAHGQLKVDGVRAVFVDTSILSREALPLDCALHCLPALHDLEQLYGEPMVFDAEYQEPEGFQATLAAMRRGTGCGTAWVFDAVPYAQWKINRFSQPIEERVGRLVELAARIESPFVSVLPLFDVATAEDAQSIAETIWARGGEGIVVKARRSPYVRGKSSLWLKLTQRQTFDGVIVDALAKDGRWSAFMVKMPDDSPSPGKVVRIGSNIPDDVRAGPDMIGAVVEVGFKDTTDSGNLRGGYFVRLRPDKEGSANG